MKHVNKVYSKSFVDKHLIKNSNYFKKYDPTKFNIVSNSQHCYSWNHKKRLILWILKPHWCNRKKYVCYLPEFYNWLIHFMPWLLLKGGRTSLDNHTSIFLGEATLTPNLRWLEDHTFTGKAMGVNLKDKSGIGATKAVWLCKHHCSGSYTATTLTPNSSTIPVPLDFVSAVDDMLHGQQLVFHIDSALARDLSFTVERKLYLRRSCWHKWFHNHSWSKYY